MPGVSGVTVVTNARAYYSTRAAADASSVRYSPRPLFEKGGTLLAKLARNKRRDREGMFVVIASGAKQSIFTFFAALWIASLRSQ
jgi:hypothetical protein